MDSKAKFYPFKLEDSQITKVSWLMESSTSDNGTEVIRKSLCFVLKFSRVNPTNYFQSMTARREHNCKRKLQIHISYTEFIVTRV